MIGAMLARLLATGAGKWVAANRGRALALGAGALVLAGVALYARCRPVAPPAPARVEAVSSHRETSASSSSGTAATRKASEKKARTVKETFRPDGSLSSRTTRDEGAIASEESTARFDASTVTSRSTDTRTVTVYQDQRPSPLGVTAAAGWSRLQLRPTDLRIGADVHAGKVLGFQVRVGAEALWSSIDNDGRDRGFRAVPSGGGVSVRLELP